ncbi:hypothetical protein CFO_g3305 [Ceratocystis platani]|uniref:Uncharacterized protein n=1 Tax=Ceratocystis fimbriata f. sp. platani TaxID=88771 RepID=A0A0F8B334_CERFI|nr:hypothetical protein CFO_g3305 [Ceratocystis platani]
MIAPTIVTELEFKELTSTGVVAQTVTVAIEVAIETAAMAVAMVEITAVTTSENENANHANATIVSVALIVIVKRSLVTTASATATIAQMHHRPLPHPQAFRPETCAIRAEVAEEIVIIATAVATMADNR